MARIRSIKPELPKDEELAELSIATRYLFALLPTHADREGRLEDRPRVLKLEVFPWDDVDVDNMLEELTPRFLVRYESLGKKYIFIRQFLKHQRPNSKESPSSIPPPSKDQIEYGIKKNGIGTKKKVSCVVKVEGIREGDTDGKEIQMGRGVEDARLKKARFQPPTIEEVSSYCLERKKGVDPQKWFDHYTSNGWKVGKNSMKDWHAAVRTWEKNEYGSTQGVRGSFGSKAAGGYAVQPDKYAALEKRAEDVARSSGAGDSGLP